MISILISSDDKFAPLAGTLIFSLSVNTNHELDIILLDYGTSDESKLRLNNCITKSIHTLRIIDFKTVRERIPSKHPVASHPSACSLYLPFLNFKSKFVAVIDSDCVACGDISNISRYDIKDCIIGAVPDSLFSFSLVPRSSVLSKNSLYLNGGFLYVNLDKWIKEDCSKQIIDALESKVVEDFFLEQDALNFVFKDRWYILPSIFNHLTNVPFKVIRNKEYASSYFSKEPKIILHYAGADKPEWIMGVAPYESVYWQYRSQTSFPVRKRSLILELASLPYIFFLKTNIIHYLFFAIVKYRLENIFFIKWLRKLRLLLMKPFNHR